LVVVGGHSRNIGKTSVVCGAVSGLREWNWTAIKITRARGLLARGRAMRMRRSAASGALSEERGGAPGTDSGRFLAAGAARACWLREALPRLRRLVTESAHTIVESNSQLQFLKPDLCLMVVDGSIADFKATSLRFLDRADALVVTSPAALGWPGVAAGLIAGKRRFEALAPEYRSDEILHAIRLKNRAVPADIQHSRRRLKK